MTDTAATTVTAGKGIAIYLDDVNLDPGVGANTTLKGNFTRARTYQTKIYGNSDGDRSRSRAPTWAATPACTRAGEARTSSRSTSWLDAVPWTLTLDGQAGSDHYIVNTTGSQGPDRNYVINVLDTGASDDGVDELVGLRRQRDGRHLPAARRSTAIAGLNGNETADRPAFVALLHGTLAQAQDRHLDARSSGSTTTPPSTAASSVYGLGGNDSFAADDNSAITTLDGGAGQRQLPDRPDLRHRSATRPRDLDAERRVRDASRPRAAGCRNGNSSRRCVAQGGAGNDEFTVYSNQAVLRLEGDDGNDLFIVRAFALAETCTATDGRPIQTRATGAVPRRHRLATTRRPDRRCRH